MVYLIRNYKNPKLKSKTSFLRLSANKQIDIENDMVNKEQEGGFRPSDDSRSDKSYINIFALKSIDKSLISNGKQLDWITNEKEILQSLTHPFIMKMHYFFSTKNYLNLVLDFWPGGELFFHITKNKRLPESVAKFYIAEVILAIEHLHKNDILYRDLKPENILIDYDGHIKLTDFGLSAINFTKDSFSTVFWGSPEYMTPEMILKEKI